MARLCEGLGLYFVSAGKYLRESKVELLNLLVLIFLRHLSHKRHRTLNRSSAS